MSPRRLHNLVAALPDGSAVARDANISAAWSVSDHLLASVVEHVQYTNVLLHRANFKPDKNVRIRPVPRPGVAPAPVGEPAAPAAPASPDEMRSFFGAARFVPQGG